MTLGRRPHGPARLDTMTRTSQGLGMSDLYAPQLSDTLKAERRKRRLSLARGQLRDRHLGQYPLAR